MSREEFSETKAENFFGKSGKVEKDSQGAANRSRFKTMLQAAMSGLLGEKQTCEICAGYETLMRGDGVKILCPECDGEGFTYAGNSEIAALAGGALGSGK